MRAHYQTLHATPVATSFEVLGRGPGVHELHRYVAMYYLHTFRLASLVALLTVLLVATPSSEAQVSRRKATPNDELKSTEIADDGRVTFRVYAPKAEDVLIFGDFGQGGPMTKDDQGVWSSTVGPLKPDYYGYVFVIDGVRTVDPKNPLVQPGIARVGSVFLVPGKEAEFEVTRDVPHGEVRAVWYKSGTLGVPRRMHVYTPPGYEGGSESYPVFYLLHGGGDEDSGWSTIGRAGFILDNLIAAKKAVPMIVVMPNGSLPRPTGMSAGRFPRRNVAALEALYNRFTDELLKEIVPVVESTYRVKTGRKNRGLAGLSMGGGQTLRVLTSHPDQFAYVAIWSGGPFEGYADEWEKGNENFLTGLDTVNNSVKHLEIVVGDEDHALRGCKFLAEVLKKRGIKHELRITGGGHTWINWRQNLHELAQKLFRFR